MIIVANTSPINYLVLIGQVEVLHKLFGQVTIPQAVYRELSNIEAPEPVRNWITAPSNWLKVQPVKLAPDEVLDLLDLGEQAAILLAKEIDADLVLLDDMKARRAAMAKGLTITGIL
ncbi:MAG: DUF3368 domain-containing protein, partial [Cyanothece sp. SIO1E1]|nr:DUF3368 domain-containing protein [Cyanothece sp. SIO1E1]